MIVHPQDIVIRPVITEKSTSLQEQNKYVFEVKRDATKIDIARAVEALFKVHVISVNTVSMPGKLKRMGRFEGKTPDWKKAIVTLREGDRIPIFEGV